MGFNFRAAPGVRVRVTRGGMRTSAGPHAARHHLGAGGVGASTGAGALSHYSKVGGRSASPGGPRPTVTHSSYAPTAMKPAVSSAAQAKAAEARALQVRFDEIQALNHLDLADARPPMAPPPLPVDPNPIVSARIAAARSEASFFQFKARREALRQAHELAQQDYQAAVANAVEGMYQYQGRLDAWWASLCAGEHGTVLGALAATFEDNEARAAAVGIDGTTVSLVVLIAPVSDIPDRRPTTTASGNLSLKRLTKTESNRVYKALVAGHVLLTAREALATAPVLTDVRIVAVRPDDRRQSRTPLVPILAAGFTRAGVVAVDWYRTDPVDALESCSHDLLLTEKGASRELQPLDLTSEPGLAGALQVLAVDVPDDANPQERRGRAL